MAILISLWFWTNSSSSSSLILYLFIKVYTYLSKWNNHSQWRSGQKCTPMRGHRGSLQSSTNKQTINQSHPPSFLCASVPRNPPFPSYFLALPPPCPPLVWTVPVIEEQQDPVCVNYTWTRIPVDPPAAPCTPRVSLSSSSVSLSSLSAPPPSCA